MNKNDGLKLCLQITLIGDSSINLKLIKINNIFFNYDNNDILYHSKYNTFQIIKGDKIKYLTNKLILPTTTEHYPNDVYSHTYINDNVRNISLKMLNKQLLNFVNSGFFGKKVENKILYLNDYWFFY